MRPTKIVLSTLAPALAVGLGLGLLGPSVTEGFSTIGGSLGQSQRDFRIFDNFTDATANDNQTPDSNFTGYQGAVMAIWKASVEWGSELHGDGNGDPTQPGGLGSGGANFDASFQGQATGTGGTNGNIHSEISGSSGGVLAYTETPISTGWRIRYYSGWTWDDGPTAGVTGIDLQGVACHEYGHALGLGHTSSSGATMQPAITGSGVGQRSIGADDIAGVQSIYGVKSPSKPLISGYTISGSSMTVLGSGFDATSNQVWFTQAGAGGTGTPIKVTGLTSGGTTLVLSVPATAGPGDILVRRNNTGHAGLSNAWPFDPTKSGLICGTTQYGLGLGGANTGSLQSGSEPVLGTTISVVASGLPFTTTGLVMFSLSESSLPLLGGTLLIDSSSPVGTFPFTTTFGIGVTSVPLPPDPALAYLAVYAQAGAVDTTQPLGWALTNGLELILCP